MSDEILKKIEQLIETYPVMGYSGSGNNIRILETTSFMRGVKLILEGF